jgi:hypothetical protein
VIFSRRLPHVVTRADLAVLVSPTYAAAQRVDEDVAHDRLQAALADAALLAQLYEGLSEALREYRGPRTTEDALIDKLSQGVEDRRAKVRPAPLTAALSAVLVSIDLAAGIAPEMMRRTLDTEKGRALLGEGLKQLGAHLVKELLR